MSAVGEEVAEYAAARLDPGRGIVRLRQPGPSAGVVTTATPPRAKPGLIRLRAIPRAGGTADFMWLFVNEAAQPLLPCKAWQLMGRCMSEGRAGVFDHPLLAQRYRRVMEDGLPQSFEQVHRIQDQQDLVVHRVSRLADGEGVAVMLINLSASRRAPRAPRSAGAPPAHADS